MTAVMNGQHDAEVRTPNGGTSPVPWVEWGRDKYPLNTSARKEGNLWVVSKMGVYSDTEMLLSKIELVASYYDLTDELYAIRVNFGVV